MSTEPLSLARGVARLRQGRKTCCSARCPYERSVWLRRLIQPKGIWLNANWYCSMDCFEEGVVELLRRLNLKADRGPSVRYRLPLGLLLLSKGLITGQHLRDALKAQRESRHGRLGEWLRQEGIISEEQVTAALGTQWGIPVFQLARTTGFKQCAGMAPLPLLEASRMALVHFMPNSRTLYVAFSDGIDFDALRALEQILECNTQPCVIGATEMEEALAAVRQMPRPAETVQQGSSDPDELAVGVRDWTQSNKAGRVRAAVSAGYLWVYAESSKFAGHILFRVPEAMEQFTL